MEMITLINITIQNTRDNLSNRRITRSVVRQGCDHLVNHGFWTLTTAEVYAQTSVLSNKPLANEYVF